MYDLWRDRADDRQLRPYEALSEVVRLGRYTVSGRLTSDTQSRLLEWCRQFGLLGVLLQRVETVVLAPRTEAVRRGTSEVIQTIYKRSSTGWQLIKMHGAELTRDTGVMVQDRDLGHVIWEPLGQTWTKFFPAVPETERDTYPYPNPSEDEFWEIYGEPVGEFLRAADGLSATLAEIARERERSSPTSFDACIPALERLNRYAAAVRLWVFPNRDGRLSQFWIAPTLLSSLAMMALQDLAEQREVRECQTCGRLFVGQVLIRL